MLNKIIPLLIILIVSKYNFFPGLQLFNPCAVDALAVFCTFLWHRYDGSIKFSAEKLLCVPLVQTFHTPWKMENIRIHRHANSQDLYIFKD